MITRSDLTKNCGDMNVDGRIVVFDKDSGISYPVQSIDLTKSGDLILNISLFENEDK